MRRIIRWPLLLLALAALPLRAQGGPAARDFLAWADSVASAGTVPALDALRANSAIWNGKERSLARGWWQFRRGVVTANGTTVEAGVRELEILATLRRRVPRHPDLLIVDARRLRSLGAGPAALARFDSARAAGGDRGVIALERARTLAMLGSPAEAEAAYWAGTTALTPAGREAYRTDLAWFIHPDTLARSVARPFPSR